jgi:hypothetical protein
MKNTIKALMVVAHPDDCVIFGWPIIKKYPTIAWQILYLTYDEEKPRGKEIKNFWKSQGISVDFCGIIDNHVDLDSGKIISFDENAAKKKLFNKITICDLLITHGDDGEYGHPHHIFVHNVLKQINITKIFFSNSGEANIHIDSSGLGDQDLSKLPLHRDVIEMFPYRYNGFYLCDQNTKEILSNNQL